MTNNEMKTSIDFIKSVLDVVQSKFDNESIDFINHYLEHEEYEMAFEGLFIEIMKLHEKPDIDYEKVVEIGKVLGLDKKSVFDYNFWSSLLYYINSNATSRLR